MKYTMNELKEEITLRQNSKHFHAAEYVDEKLIDRCLYCGLDIRDNVHFREEQTKGG